MKPLSLTVLATLVLFSSISASTLGKNIEESSLIVYNGGVGLVHEKRTLKMKKGYETIIYEGVANTIDTDSVNIKFDNSIHLFSQQYRFDKLTHAKLLNAHIGKKVEVRVLKDANKFKIIRATLLSSNANVSLVRTTDYKILSVKSTDVIFSHIPSELITKPSLVWNVNSTKDIDSHVELDYLIKNISFKADYILNISQNSANLSGWISVDNRSGKKFSDTQLTVLAGDLNYAKKSQPTYRVANRAMLASSSIEHKSHEGYHLYKVPFKIDLANNEKTQIKFITQNSIDIERKYSATLSNPTYLRGEIKNSVTQYVTIKGLDIEIPKGVVRTYSKLAKLNVLLGQTNIPHTPKNSAINLELGKNFDTKVTQTLVSRDDTKYRYNSKIEYSIKNSSDEDKSVELLVPFNRHKDSKIKTSSSYKFTKGNLVTFDVLVKANSTQHLMVNFISNKKRD